MIGRGPSIRDIQEAVCRRFGTKLSEMLSTSRPQVITRPRHVAMFLAVELTEKTYQQIGTAFHRDPTTVRDGVDSAARCIERDEELRREVVSIAASLLASCAGHAREKMVGLS